MKREAIEFGRLEEVIERVLRELALAYGVDTEERTGKADIAARQKFGKDIRKCRIEKK